jgi:hypothetical protein
VHNLTLHSANFFFQKDREGVFNLIFMDSIRVERFVPGLNGVGGVKLVLKKFEAPKFELKKKKTLIT